IEKITSSKIRCKCTIKGDNKLLLLTIPYDNGWTARVDGKEVEIIKAYNALMTIPVNKGEHIIELKFFPPKLIEGIIISLISLIFLCILCYKNDK
ncbi:YfhO family protein, partial [bacterium]|nr:YfhO family protein [bacterium]